MIKETEIEEMQMALDKMLEEVDQLNQDIVICAKELEHIISMSQG